MLEMQFGTANLQYHCRTQVPKDLQASRCGEWHTRHLRGPVYAQTPFIHSGNIYALLFSKHLEISPPSVIFMNQRVLAMKGSANRRTEQGSCRASHQEALLSLSPNSHPVLRGISFLGVPVLAHTSLSCGTKLSKNTFLVQPDHSANK